MEQSVDEEYLQAVFNKSESLEDFLSSLNSEAKEDLSTIYTHTKSGKGDLTLIGGVHGGAETVEGVRKAIEKQRPDHVAVELGPIQYELVKLFKTQSTNLELAVGIFEGQRIGAQTHPIDMHRFLMRYEEITKGNITTRLSALSALAKHSLGTMILFSSLILLIFGFSISGVITLIIGVGILWRQMTNFKDDPYREYDYALITLITNISEHNPRTKVKQNLTEKRDAHMSEGIKRLREDGDVVAVVGYNHLEGIKSRIDNDSSNWEASNFDDF